MADDPRDPQPPPRRPEVFIAQDDLVRRMLDKGGYDVTEDATVNSFREDMEFLRRTKEDRERNAARRDVRRTAAVDWVKSLWKAGSIAVATAAATALWPDLWPAIRRFLGWQ